MKTKATKKAPRTKRPAAVAADIIGAAAEAAQAASAHDGRAARAVAGLFAFLNALDPDTVEVVGDAVRERDSHRALGWVTDATVQSASEHGFGG